MPNVSADGESATVTPSIPSPPLPEERRPSLETNTATRIYPFKSVQHPSARHRRDSAARDSHNNPPLSPRPFSDEGSAGSSVNGMGMKPKSLDPFLEEPTTGEREDEKDPELASSATGETMSSDRAFLMSTRFEHQEGEDGEHLVITGRNGQIETCAEEVRTGDETRSPRSSS